MTAHKEMLVAKGMLLVAAVGFFAFASLTRAADRPDVRRMTGVDRGVALILDDVQLAGELAGDGQMVVHLLTTRPDRLAELREEAASMGLGGRVVVDVLRDDGRLPHPDRFVNVVVADLDALGERSPSRDELLRVLATRGSACLRKGGKWEVARGETELSLDDWTHRWYDATGNCVSDDRVAAFPRAVQWQTGPAMEDGTADGKIPRIADGRWLIVDTSSGDLLCRDAGNGALLWRKPLWLSARDDLVVVDGRIYFYYDPERVQQANDRRRPTAGPLVALDLLNGDLVQTFDESLRAGTADPIEFFQSDQDRTRCQTPVPWFVVSSRFIVQAYANDLVVLDRQSGKRRWSKRLGDATWFSPVVSGETILAAEAAWPARRGRHDGTAYVRAVTALAADTGEQLWRNADIHPQREVADKQRRYLSRAEFKPLSVADGLVLTLVSSYQFREGGSVAVLDLESGKQLWRHAFEPKERYTQGSQRAVIRGGEVVVMDGLGALRFNARSGEPIGEPLDNKGGLRRLARANGACTASRATADWLICNAYLYVGPDGRPRPHFGTRGACGQGVVPAHGLIFVPPTPCNCGDYLRGHMALAPKLTGREIADESRLVPGPAYEHPLEAFSAGGWPTFLGGPQRLSHSPDELPAELSQRWSTQVASVRGDKIDADRRMSERYLGALSAPVVTDGQVLVAAPEAHQVISLDANTGRRNWTFHAGGKVDSPPTLRGGLAVFGCDDGCVYAVRAEDGALAWRFRAAGVDGVGMQHGHIASVHPLPGSVLVLDGKVVAVAGQHTDLGGLHCWVLDLATSKPLAQRVLGPDQPRVLSNGVAVADEDGRGFWIGQQLHLSLELEDLDAHWFEGPAPPIAFDRSGTRMRFRTGDGRGGSTHSWKGAMAIPGRNRLLRAHRLASEGETAFGLRDPEAGRAATPVVWATKVNEQENGLWMQTAEQLGGHESYGALIAAGRRVYLGGGSRDGRHGIVHVVDAGSGELLATHSLPARVTECGLAAANGCLYVSCEDGSLVCFGEAGNRNE